jgi:hypothetical protein
MQLHFSCSLFAPDNQNSIATEPVTNPRLQLNKYLKVVDGLYSITKGDAETIKTAKDALCVNPIEVLNVFVVGVLQIDAN